MSSEILNAMELDAIGEVMNISMGSAATAISTMLDKQVNITTPSVKVELMADADYSSLEPAMIVKIVYVLGITGSNVMVFKQKDMQLILNQLMGIDEPIKDDFEFDELSMSAACEVMNQMMGASATALSDFLGKRIDISTPIATVMDENNTFKGAIAVPPDEYIVSIKFNLDIVGLTQSEFVSIMQVDLARLITSQFMLGGEPEPAVVINPSPEAVQAQQSISQPPQMQPQTQPQMEQMGQPQMMQNPQMPAPPYYPQGYPPQMQAMPGGQGYPPQYPQYPQYPGYPPQQLPPYGMPSQVMASSDVQNSGANVQAAQFPSFSAPMNDSMVPSNNMNIVMNVPLTISVEIGKAKRKIKEILEFAPGSVLELEKQAGSPVDIVVNGQLLARGDVVVIDDNFGVRITEIINVKDIVNTLNKPN